MVFKFTRLIAALSAILTTALTTALIRAETVTFEDLSLPAAPFYNGADGAGQFVSGGATFQNLFTDFGGGFSAWEGWSYSRMTDVATPGFANQYSAYHLPAGGGAAQSGHFAVAYKFDLNPNLPSLTTARITLPAGSLPVSMQVTNTTYAALTVRDGDPNGFAKQFGGGTGQDPDWFLLTVLGLGAGDQIVGQVPFYLADYRAAASGDDYIVSEWTSIDLSALAGASALAFGLTSTDNGTFGMNTPATFALDNLEFTVVPEPASAVLAIVAGMFALLAGRRAKR